MANHRRKIGKPYPEPYQIADHLWVTLRLAIGGDPGNFRTVVRDFCKTFDVPIAAVWQRMEEEADALLQPDRVLH